MWIYGVLNYDYNRYSDFFVGSFLGISFISSFFNLEFFFNGVLFIIKILDFINVELLDKDSKILIILFFGYWCYLFFFCIEIMMIICYIFL